MYSICCDAPTTLFLYHFGARTLAILKRIFCFNKISIHNNHSQIDNFVDMLLLLFLFHENFTHALSYMHIQWEKANVEKLCDSFGVRVYVTGTESIGWCAHLCDFCCCFRYHILFIKLHIKLSIISFLIAGARARFFFSPFHFLDEFHVNFIVHTPNEMDGTKNTIKRIQNIKPIIERDTQKR